jgi:predicted amidophosphoribosyltransferase
VRPLDLLLPQRCLVCAVSGALVCAACREGLPRLRPPLCARCGAATAWPVLRCRECSGRRLAFASARAAVVYDVAVRALVRGWKERGLRRLAAFAADLILELIPRPAADVLTAVPADRDRTLQRGHHPVASLSIELGRRWDLPVEALLVRTRAVPRQRGLSLAARRRNVLGTFVAPARPPPRVAIVDDVYTSGATAAAAAAALRKAGARRVEVVTFARALRGR